jgi:chloramphenicol 3-O-phosphotransferase
VTGWEQPTETRASARARRLLDLRYHLSALTARQYVDAGFTAVVQDNIYGSEVATWLEAVEGIPRHLVVLRPDIEVAVARERERTKKTGKVAYRPGEFSPSGLNRHLDATPRIGLWLDTSRQTPGETVRTILRQSDDAMVA